MSIEIIRWIVLVLVTGGFYFKVNKVSRRPGGMLSGLDIIPYGFFYLIFIIVWLILFFLIL